MTIRVQTPEGLITGSTVREITTHSEPKLFSEQGGGYATLTKGEAVVVDLGKRGVFYALMHSVKIPEDYAYEIIFDAFPFDGPLTERGQEYYANLQGKTVLTEDLYPAFVYFKNTKDPRSLTLLRDVELRSYVTAGGVSHDNEPFVKADHFEEAFGKGVRISEITVEMTQAPCSQIIEGYLHSLLDDQRYIDWIKKMPYGDPLKLQRRYFKVGKQV